LRASTVFLAAESANPPRFWLGPLAMGAASDLFGGLRYGFVLATIWAALLILGLLYNWIANPTRQVLPRSDECEYGLTEAGKAQAQECGTKFFGASCIETGVAQRPGVQRAT
jgi:hypothetical protein